MFSPYRRSIQYGDIDHNGEIDRNGRAALIV